MFIGRSVTANYAVVDPDGLNLAFIIGAGCHLTRTLEVPNVWEGIESLSLDREDHPIVKRVNDFIKETVLNIRKIGGRFDLRIEGEGIDCCRRFKAQCLQLDREILDLSELELDCVPFHIGCLRKVQILKLRNNQLRVLPRDLEALPKLQMIDLAGNPIAQLPEWLKNHPSIEVHVDPKRHPSQYQTQTDSLCRF